jgi:hypothetical protein
MSTLPSHDPAVKPTRKPRAKKIRELTVLSTSLPSGDKLVEICERSSPTAEGHLTHFYVREIPADFGRGFRWEKFQHQGGEIYHVNIGDESHPASCECLGHLHHGHRTVCRHVAGSRALIAEGKF